MSPVSVRFAHPCHWLPTTALSAEKNRPVLFGPGPRFFFAHLVLFGGSFSGDAVLFLAFGLWARTAWPSNKAPQGGSFSFFVGFCPPTGSPQRLLTTLAKDEVIARREDCCR